MRDNDQVFFSFLLVFLDSLYSVDSMNPTVYDADFEFIETFGTFLPAPSKLCQYWTDLEMENQTQTPTLLTEEHPISSSEGEEEVIQQDPLEVTMTDSSISVSMPEPPSTQEMWTALEMKFSSPAANKKKSCLKRKAKSSTTNASRVKFQKEPPPCSVTKISGGSGQRSTPAKITATPEQVKQVEEAKERTFFQFLFLVWENVITLRLLPALLKEMSTQARKTQNLVLKKEVLLWQELLEKLDSWIDVGCANLSWNKFRNTLYERECCMIFTRYQMDAEVWSTLIVCYEKLLEIDSTSTTRSFSSSITPTTSTSCTTVPIPTTPAAACSPGSSKKLFSDVAKSGGLFDSIERPPQESSVPCSISRKYRDNSVTFKSEGKPGDQVLKLDVVPYGEASKRPKKDWWMEATWRVTTSFTEDSDLGRATKLYLQAVQNHFQAGHVGRLTRENHSARNSWSGFAATQPRR